MLTIQSLIQHVENRLRQIDRDQSDTTGGEPQYPQLVVYLGDGADQAHPQLCESLLSIWPQYEKELKFLRAEAAEEGLSLAELFPDGGEAVEQTEDGVRELASALFGTRMHFRDRTKLLVYYILDTSSFVGPEDFLAWMPRIRKLKDLLCASPGDVLDVLFLLLNENLVRRKTAGQIRNCLSGFCDGNEVRRTVDNVMLLSNRRSDNAILEDWEMCYKIISASILLSNNADTQVAKAFFSNAVTAASYAREEKALPQIGQVVVKSLLGELTLPALEGNPLEDPRLPEKLGLTQQGTIGMLDQYAENSLFDLLPTEDQLEFFPRRDDRACAMSQFTAREFDEYTMGAWEQCLIRLAESVGERLALNADIRAEWRNRFREGLTRQFSNEEILYLNEHLEDVRTLLSNPRVPPQDAPVLAAAREQLKYRLSSDRELAGIFLSALQEQGWAAQDFADQWNGLLKSVRSVHTVRDGNITVFYERQVRSFYNRHGTAMEAAFSKMHDTEELEKFLYKTLDQILDSDAIFSAPFEKELESRLNEESMIADAKQYIREKLTGKDVCVYLQTDFDLGAPILSAILLKGGSPLHNSLRMNLAPTTYYYNTGRGSAAEALVIYEVSQQNLVNGEA
ncbi:MAG: hypothetical protein HFG00_02765 [Oscillibacter sp.]|nr:hypothetical protein [Oscillibacter sp.]